VVATCERWGIGSASQEIELAVSELVTNSVLHAHTHIDVELCVTKGAVEAAVRDHDPRLPILRPMRIDLLADLDLLGSAGTSESVDERETLRVGASGSVAAGRGLLIVDAVADEWGVTQRADGKEVWFAIAIDWDHAAGCTCGTAATTTSSGRPCEHIHGPWDSLG
jgi:two-component sensor histidine kinase